MKNYYEILQVNEKASKEIISKVYKVLAKKYHPDANPDNAEEASEKFKEISEAYEILSDDQKRSDYDAELKDFNASTQEQTVSLEDFLNLQNYCKELEQKLNSYSSNTNNYAHAYSQSQSQPRTNYQTENTNNYAYENAQQQAYNDAVNKAYHDAYVNNLRSMGYRVRYKKTLKEQFKNAIVLLITVTIIFIAFKIIWAIPSAKNWFLDLFRI